MRRLPIGSVRAAAILAAGAAIVLPDSAVAETTETSPTATARTTRAECLERPSNQITVGPQGVQQSGDFFEDLVPGDDHTYDFRESIWEYGGGIDGNIGVQPGHQRPVYFRRAKEGMCVVGGEAIGQQSPDLTWRELKNDYDGAAVTWTHAIGHVTVYDTYIENAAQDGFYPRTDLPLSTDPEQTSWEIRGVYAKDIRDNFVDNSFLMDGEIHDTLIDGVYSPFANRPHSSFPGCPSDCDPDELPGPPLLTISNTLVHVKNYPHQSGPDAHGPIFKWCAPARIDECGSVDVQDSIFMVDDEPASGGNVMVWPNGTYENVILVWLGDGEWPGHDLPDGVTLTTDRSVYDDARDQWLADHGW